MINVLEMDLTGQSPANRVTEDIKVSRQNRAFPLSKGSFYAKSLRVVNKLTQALLTLGKDYQLGELDIEAIRFTTQHEICKEIVILNTSLTEITVDYQAMGGEFQFNSIALSTMLQEYFDTIGKTHIVNTPDQYTPSKHVQNINDFTKLGGIKNAIERIEQAVKNGKSANFISAVIEYTEELGNALANDVKDQANDLLDQVTFLKKRNEYRNGRYYITAIENNPGADKGGAWALDSNVMLYGADNGNEVGQYVDVGEGTGYLATLKHLWRRSDSGELVFYELTASSTDIDEGDSVTISLNVSGLPAGTLVPWKLSGVSASDIVGGVLTGNFTLDNTGYASVEITTAKDRVTDGKDIMRLSLVNAPTNYISIGINDTSLTPFYRVWFSLDQAGNTVVTSVNEGVDTYVQLGGSSLNQGERLYLLTDESTTDVSDFEIPLPQYLDIDNGRAFSKFKLRADETTEDVERVVVNVCTSNNISTRVASNTLQVIDSSRAPSYTSKFVTNASGTGPAITQSNESAVVYLVIEGDSLKNGTILQLNYFGQTNQDDFVNTLPTTAQITNGKAIVQYSIKNDLKTEGNEQFGVNVLSGGIAVTSSSIVIIDTSITVGYDLYFSSTSAGADRLTSIGEGDTTYLFVRAVGLADGTNLQLGYGGTATAADIEGSRPSAVTINGGIGFVSYFIKNDRDTEGNELLTVFLKDVTDQPQASITILDTSLSPGISTKFSSNDRGTDIITNSPEGRSAYLIIQTTNVNDGETLNLTYSGGATASDFEIDRPNSILIRNNTAVIEYKIKADALEEGVEKFTVTATYPGRAISSAVTLDILDTSLPPKLELSVFVQGQQITDLNNLVAYAGQNIEIRITDVRRTLSDNAIIYCNFNTGIGIAPITLTNRINETIPTSLQMSNWVARLTFTYKPELHYQDTNTPLAFGLSPGEAAGTGPQTDTFKFVNIKLKLVDIVGYYSATQNGVPYTGAVTSNKPLWYVLKSTNAINGVGGSIKVQVNGADATVASGALTREIVKDLTFNNGYASQLLYLKPSFYDGIKELSTYLMNNSFTSIIPNTTANMKVLPPPIEAAWFLGPVNKSLILAAGETLEVVMAGSGAGGGGSRYTGGNSLPSMIGGTTAGGSVAVRHAGGWALIGDFQPPTGGGEGWWGNGSHYDNGAPGLGGKVGVFNLDHANYTVETHYKTDGGDGYGAWSRRRDGGVNTADWYANLPSAVNVDLRAYGGGGWGAAGVGDDGWSYGGGGGAGGIGYFKIKNKSNVPITIELVVSDAGVAGVSGRNGEPGRQGAVWYRQIV